MSARTAGDHTKAMRQALEQARKSPSKPSNFRVGALLVRLDDDRYPTTVAGYTLECPGNTHAEESCLLKLAEQHSTNEEGLADVIKSPHALYTTMEPCSRRLSGKLSCVERILRQRSWITHVYVGVEEPDTFVGKNSGRQMLEEAGVGVHHVPGMEKEILDVATAGHVGA